MPLKNLESFSYNLIDNVKLQEVLKHTKLEEIVSSLSPTKSGLLVRPHTNSETITARKIKLKYMKTAKCKKSSNIFQPSQRMQMWPAKKLPGNRRIQVCVITIIYAITYTPLFFFFSKAYTKSASCRRNSFTKDLQKLLESSEQVKAQQKGNANQNRIVVHTVGDHEENYGEGNVSLVIKLIVVSVCTMWT